METADPFTSRALNQSMGHRIERDPLLYSVFRAVDPSSVSLTPTKHHSEDLSGNYGSEDGLMMGLVGIGFRNFIICQDRSEISAKFQRN